MIFCHHSEQLASLARSNTVRIVGKAGFFGSDRTSVSCLPERAPTRNRRNTANVFFSLYLRSQIRIGFCSLLRVLVRRVTWTTERAPAIEVGLLIQGRWGWGRKVIAVHHCPRWLPSP